MRSILLAGNMLVLLGMAMTRPFVGVLIWSWISFMNPHQLTWGIASEIPWGWLSFLATIIGCIVAREPRKLPVTGVTVMIVLFLVSTTLANVVAMSPQTDHFLYKYFSVVKSFTFLLITISLLTSRQRIHALVWIMVISLGFFGGKGGVFTLLHGGSGGRVMGPPDTMIGDNNQLAVGLLVALPLMNFLRMHSAHRLIRAGLVFTMVLTLFAVVGSYSRGALIALTAVGLVFWARSQRKMVYGVIVVGALAGAISFMPQAWLERMQTIKTYQQDRSAESRLTMWHTAWLMAKARPLTGVGYYGTYSRSVVDHFDPTSPARAIHSIWFECLAENGFPTFFIWFGITVAGVIGGWRIIRRTRGHPELAWCADLARMSQVSIVAYLVGGTLLSLSYWDFYFTMLGAVTATDLYVRRALASQEKLPLAVLPAWRRMASSAPGGEALAR